MDYFEIVDQLKESPYRLTRQRAAVLGILRLVEQRSLSVQEVYDRAKQIDPRIGRTTIYRTLALLTKLGYTHRTWDEHGVARYSLHQHSAPEGAVQLLCEHCGAKIPLSAESLTWLERDLERAGMPMAPDLELTLSYCDKCKSRGEEEC